MRKIGPQRQLYTNRKCTRNILIYNEQTFCGQAARKFVLPCILPPYMMAWQFSTGVGDSMYPTHADETEIDDSTTNHSSSESRMYIRHCLCLAPMHPTGDSRKPRSWRISWAMLPISLQINSQWQVVTSEPRQLLENMFLNADWTWS